MLLSVHVVAGLVAIVAGYVALFVLKGGRMHRRSGTVFVWSMIVMGMTASVLSILRSEPSTLLAGPVIAYLVISAVLTVRRPALASRWADRAVLLLGAGVGIAQVTRGSLLMGSITLLAVLGDLRVVVHGPLQGEQRLARHVSRMCFAMFIATGSFFIGQMKLFPEPMRIFPLMAVPAFLPLVLMVYWLRLRKRAHRVGALAAAPSV